MLALMNKYPFWVGIILGPAVWLLGARFWLFSVRQIAAIKLWYIGTPAYQWPAMLLIILGSKMISAKYCQFMRYEGRFWFSPMTEGFKVKDDQ